MVATRRGIVLAALVVAVTAAAISASAHPSAAQDGVIRFSGDWETGDARQWMSTQCSGIQSVQERGTVHVVRAPVRQGRFAARFELPASNRNNACEVLRHRTLDVGTDDWYGLAFRLPKRWRDPSRAGWGLSVASFNYQGIWGAPVGVFATMNSIALVVQSGRCNDVHSASPGCTFSSGPGGNVRRMVLVRHPVALDRWHQIVVHVRWAVDASGMIEAWHRPADRAKWSHRVRRSGFPTVQWTTTRPPTHQQTVDKIGAYRGPASFPLNVWHDGFVVGNSFTAVTKKLR